MPLNLLLSWQPDRWASLRALFSLDSLLGPAISRSVVSSSFRRAPPGRSCSKNRAMGRRSCPTAVLRLQLLWSLSVFWGGSGRRGRAPCPPARNRWPGPPAERIEGRADGPRGIDWAVSVTQARIDRGAPECSSLQLPGLPRPMLPGLPSASRYAISFLQLPRKPGNAYPQPRPAVTVTARRAGAGRGPSRLPRDGTQGRRRPRAVTASPPRAIETRQAYGVCDADGRAEARR